VERKASAASGPAAPDVVGCPCVAIRCIYTDLDDTLLGRGGSLFHTEEGDFTLLAARALEACHRAQVEVVITSGRRRMQVMEDARLIGQTAFIFEVGCGLVIDGELTFLTGELQPREGASVHRQIAESGAPALLLDHFGGAPAQLEHHDPWHLDREVSHLFRGTIDLAEANALLRAEGHDALRLVDNGAVALGVHVFHLIPAVSSKAAAVAAHMRPRGYAADECIGVGDSREDLEVAQVVGRYFLVANTAVRDASAFPNVERTEQAMGEGFYEAVIRALAESR
jgi:hydroxymethylpyrimidine pyrophosphatase-like HAD family hydrolase